MNENVAAALEVVGGLILAAIAAALFDEGYHRWGLICCCGVVICGIAAVNQKLMSKWKYRWVTFWTLVCAVVLLFTFLIHKSWVHEHEPVKKPHIRLVVVTSHAPRTGLVLTNAEMPLVPIGGGKIQCDITVTNTPILIVPANDGESEVSLQFEAMNDPDSEANADDLSVEVELPKVSDFRMAKGWREIQPFPFGMGYSTFDVRAFSFSVTRKLIPGDSESFPQIFLPKVQPVAPFATRVPLFFNIRGSNLGYTPYGLWVAIPEMLPGDTRVIIPYMVPGQAPGWENGRITVPPPPNN